MSFARLRNTRSGHQRAPRLLMIGCGLLALFGPPSSSAQDAAPVDRAALSSERGALPAGSAPAPASPLAEVPDPKQVGGEPQSIVQVANLVYAGVKSSHCFSDHFLIEAEKQSAISTSRRFHAVKLDSSEMYDFPLVIMTGEGSFDLSDRERENLRQYVERGGFLLASAGCSSPDWNRSFRKEMSLVFPHTPLEPIPMDHPLFQTVHVISELQAKHGKPHPLDGVTLDGRLGVVYSQDGLNDTAHAHGCCCCGGNEIANCIQVNVNILAYALVH
ncbi:MAG: DUF4159 domain-containing protein [Planctomycetaceae bacterium]